MFVFYRLFDYCVNRSAHSDAATPSTSSHTESQSPTSSGREKNRVILIWWAAFGVSLFFRPAAELALRLLLFSACALLIGTLDGSLNLLIGHAVLKAVPYTGYEPSILSSLVTGALGGATVMGPVVIASACLIALLGDSTSQRFLSSHIAFLLELAVVVAISTAACSIGALIVLHAHLDKTPPLDPAHAARAGALGACILTVPIVSTAAFLIYQAQAVKSRRNESTSMHLDDNGCILPLPINQSISTPRTRKPLIVHTTAETVGYVLVTLCILTIRLLCL